MLIKRFSETAVLPRRATEGSAGYDLSADLAGTGGDPPWGVQTAAHRNRSGPAAPNSRPGVRPERPGAKHGIVPANAVGVIDWDYRGEIKGPLRNQGSEPYTVQPGERIAQMLVVPVQTPELTLTDDLGSSERGEKGFGFSGRN